MPNENQSRPNQSLQRRFFLLFFKFKNFIGFSQQLRGVPIFLIFQPTLLPIRKRAQPNQKGINIGNTTGPRFVSQLAGFIYSFFDVLKKKRVPHSLKVNGKKSLRR